MYLKYELPYGIIILCVHAHTQRMHTRCSWHYYFLYLFFMYACAPCALSAQGGQRILILFELELGRIVSHFVCACKLLIHSQRQSSHNHFPKFLPLIIAKWGLSFNKNFGGCTFKVEYSLQKITSMLFLGGPFFSKLKGGGVDLGEGAWKEGREGKL